MPKIIIDYICQRQKTAKVENNNFKHQILFNDFDFFASKVNHADLEHSQIDIGKFNGSLTQISYGPIIIASHKMDRTILQKGAGLANHTTFLILGNMEQEFSWRKNMLYGNQIGILRTGMEHRCITPPNFFGVPVTISNDYLIEISTILGYPNFIKQINKLEVKLIDEYKARQIHNTIHYIFEHNNLNKYILLYNLPKLIISSIGEGLKVNDLTNPSSRNIIFHKALDYIHANLENSINIVQLCREVGVSERNLRYIFKEKVGISPNKFVRSVKLNKVRKLIKSNGQNELINALANKLGFWHMGQFGRDYKRLFRELPSDTLKNYS